MISSKPRPNPTPPPSPLPATSADRARRVSRTNYRLAASRGPNKGSEGPCDRGCGSALAAASAGGGADTTNDAAASAKNPMPRRRNVAIKGLDILTRQTTVEEAYPAETSTRRVLRPILIRSLARQKDLNNGVLAQVVVPPPATTKPAADNPPRRVVVVQGSPARRTPASLATTAGGAVATARTAGTAGIEALSATESLRDISSQSSTTSEEFSATPETKSAHNYKAGARRGWAQAPGRLVESYAAGLETRPLTFKCVTSALVGGLGDLAAQAVSYAIRGGGNTVWHDAKAVRQTLAVAIDGLCINAPLLHFVFAVLDRWVPTEASTANATVQVFVEIFIINPIYALSFIVTTGLLGGKSVREEIVPTIRQDYGTLVFWLVVIGLALAPPHIFLFRRFSLKWRVLITDLIDLLWTFVACFVIEPRE